MKLKRQLYPTDINNISYIKIPLKVMMLHNGETIPLIGVKRLEAGQIHNETEV
jgi:hypothetical protein